MELAPISRVEVFSASDVSRYAWGRLKRFQNTAFVADLLAGRFKTAKPQHIKKQAEQIRFCLIQAREYAAASQVVTLATQPNLLYYSIMSLALAEILFKQSGNSSLDRARETHGHHGLNLKIESASTSDDTFATSAGRLGARPAFLNGARGGTFEIWHSSSRESSIAGRRQFQKGHDDWYEGFDAVFIADQKRPPLLSTSGISLLDCLSRIPLLQEFMTREKVSCPIVKASVERKADLSTISDALIITASNEADLEAFAQHVVVAPRDCDCVKWRTETRFGFLDTRFGLHWPKGGISVPPGCNLSRKELRFWTGAQPLNEFGLYFVALFIAGNYARYYPDLWLRDVERTTTLSIAIEELISSARVRVPLLLASELERVLLIPETV